MLLKAPLYVVLFTRRLLQSLLLDLLRNFIFLQILRVEPRMHFLCILLIADATLFHGAPVASFIS